MTDYGICVSIRVDGYFRHVKFYERDTLLSQVRTKALKELKLNGENFVLHSKGRNRALEEYDDVLEDEVNGKAVTLGQLTKKCYSSEDLELEFVVRESVQKVYLEKMARWAASDAAGGAVGAAAAPREAGSKRKFAD